MGDARADLTILSQSWMILPTSGSPIGVAAGSQYRRAKFLLV
jgi:hypothetical protein